MTQEDKDILLSGMALGLFVSLMLFAICMTIAKWRDPVSIMHPNKVLNSDNYRIDTIITICNHDTTLTYKFVKK